MIAIIFACISAVAAEAGGLLALRRRGNLTLTLAFTAGALIGLVAFDLLPEIFELVHEIGLDSTWPMVALVVGFLLFHSVEKSILVHHSQEHEYVVHQHPHVGLASAAALIGHSFLDGASIGIAFQIDNAAGLAVAVAVIGHRFADGFNGVNLMVHHQNSAQSSRKVLLVVALAPIIGALSTHFISFSESFLAVYLGFFAGFILYIGASDILPQAHSKRHSLSAVAMTIFGALCLFGITRFV